MTTPEFCNSPRPVYIRGVPYLVGRLTPWSWGMLEAFRDAEAEGADWDSEEAIAALYGPHGRPLLLYAALYRHNPGIDLAHCQALAADWEADDPAFQRIVGLLTASARPAERPTAPDARLPGRATGWAKILDWLCRDRHLPYDSLIHLSYDQLSNMLDRGGEGGGLSHADVAKLAEERYREIREKREAEAARAAGPGVSNLATPAEASSASPADAAVEDAIAELKAATGRAKAGPETPKSRRKRSTPKPRPAE